MPAMNYANAVDTNMMDADMPGNAGIFKQNWCHTLQSFITIANQADNKGKSWSS